MLSLFMKKMKKNKKGFTLIELIVVIAILAILAMIAVPRFAGMTDKAKVSADEQLAKLVQKAVMMAEAAEDIKVPTGGGSIAVTYSGTALVYTPTTLNAKDGTTALTATTLRDILSPLIKDEKLQKYTSITLTTTGSFQDWAIGHTP